MSATEGLPPPMPSAYRLRLDAAWRTLRLALRRHVRRNSTRPVPFSNGAGGIDRLDLREGRMRVCGWSAARRLIVSTECQTHEVVPALPSPGRDGARGFDIRLAGTERLSVEVDGVQVLSLETSPPLHRGLAAARLTGRLLRVPVVHGRDLLAFALGGDSAAGRRLETLLLPRAPAPQVRALPPGLFEPGACAPLHDVVDIIVPVFNAAEDVRLCLDRLARFTAPRHRVTVIDDASTDPQVTGILEEFAGRHPGARILRNETNLGFVRSVNRGLMGVKGHAVLLNTDAFVPEGWLERLLHPILADPLIASVTPMTNNGETASVPRICRASDLSAGAADRIDRAAATLNPALAIAEAPTGVGFCMALSSDWLARVPQLDLSFGRGYGEEVDWCQRTAALGGRHVITGTLFVEHRGGQSFGPEKAARIATNNRLIARRYPGYDAAVQAFIDDDPAIGPRLALALAGVRGRVPVYLGHRLGGGSEYWLRTEIGGHLDAGGVAVVIRDGDTVGTVRIELHQPGGPLKADLPLSDLPRALGLLEERHLFYSNLVGAEDPLALAETALAALGPRDRLDILFHDFFPLCPSYNLLDATGAYCGLPGDAACQSCYGRLVRLTGARPSTIGEWRNRWHALLARADAVTVFSNASRDLVLGVWPDLRPQLSVKPHLPPILPRKANVQPGKPTVGVLGAISRAKGAEILHDLASEAEDVLRIVVIGTLDPAYAHPAVRVHGSYQQENITGLAERYGIDRWLIPAIWPETFSYATHECIATGLPVFAFDLGAQGEAVAQAPNGRLLDRGLAPDALVHALMARDQRSD